MLLATIGDEVRVEETTDPEFKTQTEEEMLGVAEEVSYEGLTQTEEVMIDGAVQTSLADMPSTNPSATVIPFEVTLDTDA